MPKIPTPAHLQHKGRRPWNMTTILPFLPGKEIFFDNHDGDYGHIDDVMPWAITTRISASNHQYLKLRATRHDIGVWLDADGNGWNIRKMTERECYRLMGVRDTEYDRIRTAGLSASAQYKLAGNSIVVDVLASAIFEPLLFPTPEEGVLF